LLILNDEMSNKSKRDISMVKKLCSVQWFNVRRPYGRSSEDVRRISGLCGTSNDLAVLSDPSGNRRVIPIGVRRIIFDAYNAIDKKALWAEAYAAYKSGERYELNSEDIAEMAEFSAEFEESSPEREGFVSYFELSAEGEPGCQFLTNTQIKAYIEIRLKQRINSRRLGMELTAMGAFKLSKKIHGQSYKVYAVKEVSGIVVSKFLETEAPF
jgi:predicted P-loop ATPase